MDKYELFLTNKGDVLGITILKRKGRYLVYDKEDKDCNKILRDIEFVLEHNLGFSKLKEDAHFSVVYEEIIDVLEVCTRPSKFVEIGKGIVSKNWTNLVYILILALVLYGLYAYQSYITGDKILIVLIAVFTALITSYIQKRR